MHFNPGRGAFYLVFLLLLFQRDVGFFSPLGLNSYSTVSIPRIMLLNMECQCTFDVLMSYVVWFGFKGNADMMHVMKCFFAILFERSTVQYGNKMQMLYLKIEVKH